MSEEKILVQRVLDGDQSAFRNLIVKYQRLVEHMVGRLVEGREDREDLCQEIFIKIYFRLKWFRFDAKLSTWIATIAYRESINFLRKKHRRPVLTDMNNDNRLSNLADENRPDQIVETNDIYANIEEWIRELPEMYRIILTLFHTEGFKYEEIAVITGLPDGTVKSYLFRARKVLKEKMKMLTHQREMI